MKKWVRSEWIVAALVALCGLAAVATLRATAQQAPLPQAAPPARAMPAPAAPPAAAPANREDATVAPDKAQSADNNVSFPVDI